MGIEASELKVSWIVLREEGSPGMGDESKSAATDVPALLDAGGWVPRELWLSCNVCRLVAGARSGRDPQCNLLLSRLRILSFGSLAGISCRFLSPLVKEFFERSKVVSFSTVKTLSGSCDEQGEERCEERDEEQSEEWKVVSYVRKR